jgi:hypothetical protein
LIVLGVGLALGISITRLVDLHVAAVDWEKTIKAVGELVQAIAIAGAGWWFLAQRSHKQKISIGHKIQFVKLAGSKLLIHVRISVKNTGRVLITPNLLTASLHQVLPMKGELSALRSPTDNPDDNWPQLQSIPIDCMG